MSARSKRSSRLPQAKAAWRSVMGSRVGERDETHARATRMERIASMLPYPPASRRPCERVLIVPGRKEVNSGPKRSTSVTGFGIRSCPRAVHINARFPKVDLKSPNPPPSRFPHPHPRPVFLTFSSPPTAIDPDPATVRRLKSATSKNWFLVVHFAKIKVSS